MDRESWSIKTEICTGVSGREVSSAELASITKKIIATMRENSRMANITVREKYPTKMEMSMMESSRAEKGMERGSTTMLTETTTMAIGRTTTLMGREPVCLEAISLSVNSKTERSMEKGSGRMNRAILSGVFGIITS